jgi:mono/diheme cytochrome c family protein
MTELIAETQGVYLASANLPATVRGCNLQFDIAWKVSGAHESQRGYEMHSTVTVTRASVACAALIAALFAFAGCSNPNDTPPGITKPSGGPSGGMQSAPGGAGGKMAGGGGSGKDLFASGCRCHNGGKAPDLSHVGADPKHNAGWIAEYASNPKSKDPNSKMPPMEGKVPSDDLKAISEYLAAQK